MRHLVAKLLIALALGSIFGLGSALRAQSLVEWTDPRYRIPPRPAPWEPVAADARLRAIERVVGDGWRCRRDALGAPAWFVGPGATIGATGFGVDEAVRLGRVLVGRMAEALQLDPRAELPLARTSVTSAPSGNRVIGVDFEIRVGGSPLHTLDAARRVKLRFDATRGSLVAFGSDAVSPLRADGSQIVDAAGAAALALAQVPSFAPGTGRVERVTTIRLLGRDADGTVHAKPAHDVVIRTDAPSRWRVVLDATTGQVIAREDALRRIDVAGTIAGGVLDRGGGAPPAASFRVLPLPHLAVSLTGAGTTITDSNGAFRFQVNPPLPGSPTLAGKLTGPYCAVRNAAGRDLTFSRPAAAGNANNIVINPVHRTEFVTAEVTAFRSVTNAHERLAAEMPAFGTAWPRLPTNVNINNACNATFDGTALNFYRAGGGCANTAFPDIIAHEYGHALHQWFHGSLTPAGFSEGIGDHLAIYFTGDRRVGRDFRGRGTVLRDYRPNQSSCCTQWPPKGVSIYRDGEIWAGFTADLRDALIRRYGATVGGATAARITIAQYDRNPSDIRDGVLETFIQDDNDANLLNGTPNFALIAAAADAHSIPRVPDPAPIVIAHAPLPDTRDAVNALSVRAAVFSQRALQSVVLNYRVDNGPLQSQAMVAVGALYTLRLAPPPRAATITYALVATDTASNVARSPASGAHRFFIGRTVQVFGDDFEVDRGWTPAFDDNASSGRFERVDPFAASSAQSVSQPENDTTPGRGVRCYVTQNGLRAQDSALHDVDAGHTSIVSPTLDLTPLLPGSVRVAFNYWFTAHAVPDDTLSLAVSSDGGGTWNTLWATKTSTPQWLSATVRIPGPYTARTKLRFRAVDNPNNSITDALIDDVAVRGVDDKIVRLVGTTAIPVRGTVLGYKASAPRAPGAAFVYSIAFTPGPTPLGALGTSMLGWPLYPMIAGGLDRNGDASFGIPIPNHPLLIGLRVYTEGFVATGTDFLFSNRWDVVIR